MLKNRRNGGGNHGLNGKEKDPITLPCIHCYGECKGGHPSEGFPYPLFPLIKKVGAYGYFVIQKRRFRYCNIDQLLKVLKLLCKLF